MELFLLSKFPIRRKIPNMKRTLADPIGLWLRETGTTQTQLATRIGVSKGQMSRILGRTRRMSYETLLAMSAEIHVPVENLVRWTIGDYRETKRRAA